MDKIVQKIRVLASEKDGYVVVVQSIPLLGSKEYVYEVEIDKVEEFIDELDKQFKEMVIKLLEGMNDDEDNE